MPKSVETIRILAVKTFPQICVLTVDIDVMLRADYFTTVVNDNVTVYW